MSHAEPRRRTESFRSFDPADDAAAPAGWVADFEPFDYLHFAKTRMPGARFPLCVSGVPSVAPLFDAETFRRSFETGDLGSPLARWRSEMAARFGVPGEHTYPTLGASGAVFVALSALAAYGADGRPPVAVEHPAYAVFRTVATLLGHPATEVPRLAESGYGIDLDAVDAAFERGARVFCTTDLHNPTGVALSRAEVEALDEIAARHDAWVLLDEAYREFLPGPVETAYRPGGRIVVTGSFTKVHGLGPMRAGWIFAPPEILARAERVEEAACGVPPSPWLELLAASVAQADALRDRGRALAAAGRAVMDAWLAETPLVTWTPPAAGITGLVRVEGLRDSFAFSQRLRAELDVQVVPGAFFGAEGAIRVSFGLPPETLRPALDVLALGIPPLR